MANGMVVVVIPSEAAMTCKASTTRCTIADDEEDDDDDEEDDDVEDGNESGETGSINTGALVRQSVEATSDKWKRIWNSNKSGLNSANRMSANHWIFLK